MALSAERLAEWMASDLSQLDLLVIQLDGLSRSSGLRLSLTLPSTSSPRTLNRTLTPHSMINGNTCFAYFNKIGGIPKRHTDDDLK